MEESKGQAIFLSVIGVSTLLVAIVGATFAWFSITVEGNDEAQNMVFTTANLGVVSFNDGAEIDASGIITPFWGFAEVINIFTYWPGFNNPKSFLISA